MSMAGRKVTTMLEVLRAGGSSGVEPSVGGALVLRGCLWK